MAWKRVDGLRIIEFGNVGASGTALLDFNFNGNKRATAGLLEHDYEAECEQIEEIGEVLVVLGNNSEEVGRISASRL